MTIHQETYMQLVALSNAYTNHAGIVPHPDMDEIAGMYVIPFLVLCGWEKNILFRQMHKMPVSGSYPLVPVIFLPYKDTIEIPVFVCDDILCHQNEFGQVCRKATRSLGVPFCFITSFHQLQYVPVCMAGVGEPAINEPTKVFLLHEYPRRFSELESLINPQRNTGSYHIPSKAVQYLSKDLTQFRVSASRQIVSADPCISSVRLDLYIQQIINQAFFQAIGNAYGIPAKELRESSPFTLRDVIIHAALNPAPRDIYDPDPADPVPELHQDLVFELISMITRSSSWYSLTWIQPFDLAEAFRLSLIDRMQNQGGIASVTKREWGVRSPDSLCFSREFLQDHMFPSVIASIISEPGNCTRIFDPLCGTGQMVLLICDLVQKTYTGKKVTTTTSDERKKDIFHIYTFLSTHLFCCDPDPTFASVTQAIIGFFLLFRRWTEADSCDLHQDTINPQNRFFVRAGSVIFGDDLISEMTSPFSSHHLLRYMHPIRITDLGLIDGERFDFIISSGFPGISKFHPDIDRYLQERYASYQYGSDAGLFWMEGSVSFLKPGGHAFFITDTRWLRSGSENNFREWLLHTGIRTIITGPGEKSVLYPPMVALHMIKGLLGTEIQIINRKSLEYTGESSTCIAENYSIPVSFLNPKTGWELQDPRIDFLIAEIQRGGIPLDVYLLGEIYTGKKAVSYKGPGIILLHDNHGFRFEDADNRLLHKDRTGQILVIPGDDPYLLGILSSSLIWWFVRQRTGKNASDTSPPIRCMMEIPIPVLDCTDEQQQLYYDTILSLVTRERFLGVLLSNAHTFHDKNRIRQSIFRVRQELDATVNHLYHISPEGKDLIHTIFRWRYQRV